MGVKLIAVSFFFLCSLCSACQSTGAAKGPAVDNGKNEVFVIVENFKKMDNNIKFAGKSNVIEENPELSYIDQDGDVKYLELTDYPASKTFVISCPKEYLVLDCRYNFFDKMQCIVNRGDTVIVRNIKGLPFFVPTVNKANEKSRTSYLIERINAESTTGTGFTNYTKFMNPLFFMNKFAGSPDKNRPLIKAFRTSIYEATSIDLKNQKKIIDSLYSKQSLLDSVYFFQKAKIYAKSAQLKIIQDEITYDEISELLANKYLKTGMAQYSYRQVLNEVSDKFFVSKASSLDLKDGVNKDYRQVYDLLSASSVFRSTDKQRLLTREFIRIADTFSQNDFDKYYKLFQEQVSDTILTNQVKEKYALRLLKTQSTDQSASLMMTNGQKTSLDQVINKLKGKIIYLDLWASWCAPCRQGMKKSAKLLQELGDKGIVFVYLSIDKKLPDWRKANEQENLSNYTYTYILTPSEGSEKFLKTYKLESIPRYMIVDKSGKVLYANAPRVESQELKPILLGLAK